MQYQLLFFIIVFFFQYILYKRIIILNYYNAMYKYYKNCWTHGEIY